MSGRRAGRAPRGGGLLLRGLWWRRGLTGSVLLVGIVTVTAAALGPLYARAAGESTLHDRLTQASWRAGIHLTGSVDLAGAGALRRLESAAPEPGKIPAYGRRIEGIRSSQPVAATAIDTGNGPLMTSVVWRQGACAHIVIVRGRCPQRSGDALISERTFAPRSDPSLYLAPHPWVIGTLLDVGPLTLTQASGLPGGDLTVRVVGTYRPRDTADPFWFGRDYFNAHPGIVSGDVAQPPTIDALLVSRATMLSVHRTAYVDVDFDYPLSASAVRLDNEAAERSAVAAVLAHPAAGTPLTARSGLDRVLRAADSERHLLEVGTLLVTLQLGLLAWLVLFQIVADAIEARGNEIAMAKLRGRSPLATLRFGLSEPLLLLVAAVPLGVLAAWGLTHAFAAGALAPGIPVVTTWAPLAAALVAFAGGVVAAGLAGYTTLTRSVLDQWRRTTRRPRRGWPAVVADVLVSAATVTTLVVLLRHHDPRDTHAPVTLLMPGLLVLAVALVGVRLLPLTCRGLARLTRGARTVGLFLASRQVARRPVGLRLAALLAVAVGLATFAVTGESVARTNRDARAAAELGADRVATVQFVAGHDPIAATHRADPAGTWAMAAATWLPFGGDSVVGTVLGVDASRLPAVGHDVAGGVGTRELANAVRGAGVAAVTTTAARIRVHLTASALTGDTTPQLFVEFSTPSEPYLTVVSSSIHDGAGSYTAKLPCAAGCTLRGLTWARPTTEVRPMSGTIVLTGIDLEHDSRWRPVDLHSEVQGSWRAARPQGQATDHVTLSAGGVRDVFTNRNGGYGGIEYGSDPTPIPAVSTIAAVPGSGLQHVIDGLGVTADFRVVRRTRLVPVELADGVVMDVRFLDSQLPAFAAEADWQIWIGAHAPPDAIARLARAGLTIDHVASLSARVTILSRQGPALALLLLLACAVAGAALAAGATATSIAANSRRRSYELAALRAVGVGRRALFRAGVLEQLLLLGTGVVLGVPTGLVAARIAMPVIPEFADLTPITLRYTPPLGPALLFTAAFVVLLGVAAFVAAALLIRSAKPARLRAAE